ncbi:MAG TPA: thioredoxin family protein [Pyrinomonadaceae bacterium]|jgi:peroxiredoxin
MKKHYIAALVFALLVTTSAIFVERSARAGDTPASGAVIGQPIPDFTLPDVDGNKHSLASLKGKNGTLFIFIATRCPVSNAYNERMDRISQDYKARGINVVGINANSTEPAEEVKSHAAEKHLSFTILKDDGNKIADQWGAAVTPEAYLLNAEGKLVYHGRIDNSRNGDAITSNDLRDAIDEMLAAKPVAKTEAKAFGCTIKRVATQ